MMPRQTIQHKLDESSEIADILIDLTSNHGFTNREIANTLGVSESFVSRALNKKTTSGKQFLSGLKLLAKLQTRKGIQYPDQETQMQTQAFAQAAGVTIEEFAGLCLKAHGSQTVGEIIAARRTYPAPGSNPALNEEASCANVSPAHRSPAALADEVGHVFEAHAKGQARKRGKR